MKKVLSIFICLLLILTVFMGYGKKEISGNDVTNNESESETTSNADSVEAEFSHTDAEMFTDRDLDDSYEESKAIRIELNENSVKADSNSVKISGSTFTITEDATYIVTGTLNDGMMIVDAPDTAKLQIVLNGVSITNSTSAPLYIREADKVFVTLAGENTLANGGIFNAIDDYNIDAAVFSKQDLTFNGSGSLTVISPAGHGIVGKDDLIFTGGSYTITSAFHAIDANDSVRVQEADFTLNAGKDGIHVENTDDPAKGFLYITSGSMKIECEGDGISAGAYMQIRNGNFEILAGGGSENGAKEHADHWGGFGGGEMPEGMPAGGDRPDGSAGRTQANISSEMKTTITEDSENDSDSSSSMKGFKAANSILIENGMFTVNSADDAVHSDESVTINGGIFEIASGDDAVHAEKTLTIADGKLNITASYEGLEALHIVIHGGNIELASTDDGLNAAGGTDQSGIGGRDTMFGGGDPRGGMSSNSNGSIVISGGTIYICASGDGIDANGTLEISGGYTTVVGPVQGDTATLDYDVNGTISGGTFIGTGSSNMAQSFHDSKQGVIAVSVGNQSANTNIILTDQNGKELISYTPEQDFEVVILSSPEIKSGETYTITIGSQSEELQAS